MHLGKNIDKQKQVHLMILSQKICTTNGILNPSYNIKNFQFFQSQIIESVIRSKKKNLLSLFLIKLIICYSQGKNKIKLCFYSIKQLQISIYIILLVLFMGGSQNNRIVQQVRRSAGEHTKKEIQSAVELAKKTGMTEEKAFEIASLSVTDLIERLNSKTLKSLDIVLAVIIRSSTIGKDLNCFTETNFEYAIEAAKKCDQQRLTKKKNNWTFGQGQFKANENFFSPLFGVPISIKDTYDMDGFLTTVGLQSRLNKKFPQSALIKAIKNAGGIPFIRTNVPQLGMSCQCQNKVWGRTVNPWNRQRTVGGSSGGQAGLISARCSFLGMGSDLAGSVRIPSEFCGLFGLKPYSKRISANYHTKFSNGFGGIANVIPLCIGPLARSTSDLAYFMKIVTQKDFFSNQQDPFTKIVPFDQPTYQEYRKNNKKLRIGIINQIASIQPTKASARAIKETSELLTKLGHQCFKIDFPNERQIICQFYRQNLGSQAAIYRQILQGQAPIKQYKSLFQVAEMSAPIRGIAKCGSKVMMPRISSYVMQNIGSMSAYQYQDHVGRTLQYKEDWIKYWRNQKLDFVICPGFGSQAILHQKSENISLAAAYTFVWNLLDLTVGSVPVTQVRQDEQQYETTHEDMVSNVLRQNARNSVGLPVGIQLIGLPYQEQKVLGMMAVLQKNIQFYKNHPLPVLK